MSEEEPKITQPEPAAPESWTLENAPQAPAHPEDVLSEKLSEVAQRVTSELDTLRSELTPAEPVFEAPIVEAVADAGRAAEIPQPEPVIETQIVEPVVEPRSFELPPVTPPVLPPIDTPQTPAEPVTESTSDDRLMAMLAWASMVLLQLPLVSVIQLLSTSSKNRPFQRHHAVSSLLFYAAAGVYEILAGIAYVILGVITLGIGFACLWVIFFVPHLLALYYALQAYNGKRVELPILSDFARKQGWM